MGILTRQTAAPAELAWVDEFIRNVKPFIHVRAEDSILIMKPNQVHRLNARGVEVLDYLLGGGTAAGLAARVRTPEHLEDISLFLFEVRRCLDGTMTDHSHTRAVKVEPLPVNFFTLPVLSEVAVTSRCNLRCRFCYAGCSCNSRGDAVNGAPDDLRSDVLNGAPGDPRNDVLNGAPGDPRSDARNGAPASSREMTTAEIKSVLDKIYNDAQAPSVSFTGGEALLRPDIFELIDHAARTGFRVNLITNGTLVTRDGALRLRDAGLDSAQVSLEGTTAEVHGAITGSDSSFSRSVAAVGYLRDAGITVHTNTTLNRLNLTDCLGMPRFVSEVLGLERFSMNLVIPSGSAAANEDLLLRYSEVGPSLDRIHEASRRHGVEFMWYSPTPLCIFNPIIRGLGNKGCAACDGLLSIDSNGDVRPCSSFDDPVGNLLDDGFRKIWESGRARSYRLKEFAHPRCRECDNLNACHGACPLYWRHFGYGELTGPREVAAHG